MSNPESPDRPRPVQDFVAALWKRSPQELKQLAQTFADKKMDHLAEACRVIASMKSG